MGRRFLAGDPTNVPENLTILTRILSLNIEIGQIDKCGQGKLFVAPKSPLILGLKHKTDCFAGPFWIRLL